MSERDCQGEGATHHMGCWCHEKRRDDELTAYKAAVHNGQQEVDEAIRRMIAMRDNFVPMIRAALSGDAPRVIELLEEERDSMKKRAEKAEERNAVLEEEVNRIEKELHYPECWDTAAYPDVLSAIEELFECSDPDCPHTKKRPQDLSQGRQWQE